jgi:catechol 2,3-dioxygenase-like lactoylglutathione lyase family enzyme
MAVARYLADDVDAAVAFYTEKLGFALVERLGPPFAIVAHGDLELWLSGPGSSAARPMPDGRVPEPGGWGRVVLVVNDIEARLDELEAAGVRFRSGIVRGPGGSQVVLDDPAGNPVELFQPR